MTAAATIDAARARPQRREIGSLASFRWFAAATIIFHHYGAVFWDDFPLFVRGAVLGAYIWPSYFFVLSGFILTYSYLDLEKGTLATDLERYFRARAGRILPTYWIAWAAIAPFLIARRFHRDALPMGLAKLTAEGGISFLGLQAWIPPLAMAWNYPAWTVSIELFLYACFPFLLVRFVRMSVGRMFAVTSALWLVQNAIALGLERRFHGTVLGHITHLPLLHLHEFAIGIVIGLLYVRGAFDRLRHDKVRATIFQVVSLFGLLLIMELPFRKMMPLYEAGTLAPIVAVFVAGQTFEAGALSRLLDLRPLRALGRASYAFYILQEPLNLWYRAMMRIDATRWYTPREFWLYLAFLTAVSLAVSQWLEEPARRAVMRFDWRRVLRLPKAAPAAPEGS